MFTSFASSITVRTIISAGAPSKVKHSKSLNGTSSLNEGDMTTAMRGISIPKITSSAIFILALLQAYYVFTWWFGNIWNPLAACTVPIIGKEHERTMQLALCSHLQEGLHAACLKVQCSSMILQIFRHYDYRIQSYII